MKNKLIKFLLAMGVPFSAMVSGGGGCCNGICSSCSFACTPGVFTLLILAGSYFYGKVKVKAMKHE